MLMIVFVWYGVGFVWFWESVLWWGCVGFLEWDWVGGWMRIMSDGGVGVLGLWLWLFWGFWWWGFGVCEVVFGGG